MQSKTLMVREYASEQDFHLDEQKLSREGWSVEPAVQEERKSSVIDRLRSRLVRKPPSSLLVVTYSRSRPS